jgi:hypothetical protein
VPGDGVPESLNYCSFPNGIQMRRHVPKCRMHQRES